MVSHLLRLATQRSFERKLASDLLNFPGPRVTLDPLQKLLGPKSKVLSDREKYLASSVFCSGVWTRARARAAGYQSDGRCPLC
eukprot:6237744-Pyramimonas_sp.AAC.1